MIYLCDANYGQRDVSFAPLRAFVREDGAIVVFNPCCDDSPETASEVYASLEEAAESCGFIRRFVADSPARVEYLGGDWFNVATIPAALLFAEGLVAEIRKDWAVSRLVKPADAEGPVRVIVEAEGAFARASFPTKNQGRASYRAVVFVR